MPVTLTAADHGAAAWEKAKVTTPKELLKQSCPKEYRNCKNIVQSSFSSRLLRQSHITPSQNGFVRAVYHAYSNHHHLTLRPEDVWFSILCQLSFYINAHAEELRSFFVSHQGKKHLEVVDAATIEYADFGALAVRMTQLIEKEVVDPELRTWIMPAFSTTTYLQKYFSYGMTLVCGIPTVTLLGEKADWESMVAKLDKIPQLGEQPAIFTRLLRPVLERFVTSFDDPSSQHIRDFWSKCAHETGGSGPYYLSGWITAFCFWDEDGKCLYRDGPIGPVTLAAFAGNRAGCELDGILYHRVDTSDIPCGFASVPVKVNDNGDEYNTRMVAGLVGIQATSSADDRRPRQNTSLSSIQPVSGWWMYEERDVGPDESWEMEEIPQAATTSY
ncbi:hypothetical protein BDV27DRAFT_143537 [Aspergillus caelatus]|uniref:DUF4419 domain-containing protein n=1 Tax=Aspergillus caelatus TaxID=61420 RepID=A0A5N7ABW4_9EURO|nr:uncharacterized protein BDV27DRAFT_143537 [Aspergillus caelatus]KAE8366549.1 hypothetical protein BDV27DRAFT_143537 [Aspergillus caelatus]